MNVSEARLCLMLHSIPGLGDTTLARLFLHYGSAAGVWDSNPPEWRSMGASTQAVNAARILQRESGADAPQPRIEQQLETLDKMDAEVLSLGDPRYPALLQEVYDPPPILYARGEVALLAQAQLGIVGSRKSSPAGVRAAGELSAALVCAGLHVCSGLAIGIDQAAHSAALDAGGKTLAVMATGLDIVYPSKHRNLAQEVVQNGCLLTEFPPGARPTRQRFPKRNRIISGLSLGVLVVEAAQRSGSLITARTAMEQGREVFALPWSIYHPGGRGCLRLIRDGAKMVEGVEDIVEELGALYQCQLELAPVGSTQDGPMPDSGGRPLSPDESLVLELVGSEAVTVDQLVSHTGLTVPTVLAALSALEIGSQISRCEGGYILG